MNEKILAARLFQLKQKESDPIILTIKSAQLLKGADLDLVLASYYEILEKKLLVAEVESSVELGISEQDLIRKNISEKFPNDKLVFVFYINTEAQGLEIKVADNIIDFGSGENKF